MGRLSGQADEPAGSAALGRPTKMLVVATVSSTITDFLLPYAHHFRELGWHVSCAANGATSDAQVRDAFDEVFELPLSRSMRDVRALRRGWLALVDILATGPDIVHVHTPIASFMTRLAIRRLPHAARPAVVYTAHGFHFHAGGSWLSNGVFLTAERVAGRWTDRLVVMNDEDEAAALRHRIVPRRRLVRMPGIGLDTAFYSPSAVSPNRVAAARQALRIAAATPIFTIVAELSERKRQGDAVTALARMRHGRAHLVLAGTGPSRASLELLVESLGIADRVHFLGQVRDIRPVVRASTALILPSSREGLARCVMEALSLEIPVIASTAKGNAELVGLDAGIVIPVGDTSALAAAMDQLAEQPDEGARMGRRGRCRMVERYDIAALVGLHERMCSQLMEGRSAGRTKW